MKKGFTLVELIAVVVILGVLGVLISSTVIKHIENTKQKAYDMQIERIVESANKYLYTNSYDVVWNDNVTLITIESIIEEGELKKPILNPKTGYEFDYDNIFIAALKYGNGDIETYPVFTTPEECFVFDEGTNTITDYNVSNPDCPSNIIIPSQINSVDVYTIASGAFYLNSLENIYMEAGLTTIGAWAFEENGLKHVNIPNTVTTINQIAFYNNKLTKIKIPDSVTTLISEAFQMNELNYVDYPSSLSTVPDYCFSDNKLTEFNFPTGLTEIGDYAFQNNLLNEVDIPEGVVSIGQAAFLNNALTKISLPSTLSGATAFGLKPFNNNLMPEETAFIYERNADGTIDKTDIVSYAGRKKTDIIIPDNVITIGAETFRYCDINSVTIPNGVTLISTNAFDSNNLTTITIPNSVTSISSYAFRNNPLMTALIDNVEGSVSIGGSAFPTGVTPTYLR